MPMFAQGHACSHSTVYTALTNSKTGFIKDKIKYRMPKQLVGANNSKKATGLSSVERNEQSQLHY